MARDFYRCLGESEPLRQAYYAAQVVAAPGKRALATAVAQYLRSQGVYRALLVPSDIGQFAAPIADTLKRASLVGLDKEYFAAKEFARHNISQSAAVVGDAEKMPFGTACFDAVISVLGMHLMTKPWHFLRSMACVTRPEGQLILATLSRKQAREHPMSFFGPTRRFPDLSQIRSVVASNGWRVLKHDEVCYETSMKVDDVPVAFSACANSLLFSVDAATLARFHKSLMDSATEGVVTLTFRWTVIDAIRGYYG